MPVTVINHPLVKHKIGLMRSNISTQEFRNLANELCIFLACEATKALELEEYTVQAWSGVTQAQKIAGKKLTVVPILRAGIGMLNGFLEIVPNAKISTIGLFRDETTLQPVSYYAKLTSNISERKAFILDPMLATGGSACATINTLKQAGCKNIYALFLFSAPEGIALLQEKHPDVIIYTCCIDEKLNDQGYIIPGIGDAGDRLFGTQ